MADLGSTEPDARIAFLVEEEANVGARVDVVLAEISGESRAQVRRWIDAGRVSVGGETVRLNEVGEVCRYFTGDLPRIYRSDGGFQRNSR